MEIDLHKIAPGDSVYGLTARKYGAARVKENWDFIQGMVQATNPELTDLGRLTPGRYIALPRSLPPVPRPLGAGARGVMLRPDPSPVAPGEMPRLQETKELVCRMSEPEQGLIGMTEALTVGNMTMEGLKGSTEFLSKTIASDIDKLERAFAAYKAGQISHAQYYGKLRPALMGDINRKLSPGAQKVLRDLTEAGRDPLRMGRGTGRVQGSDLFDKLARNAKHIKMAANVATVAQTGHKFFATERPEERREVLVVTGFQTVGGMAGAKAAGAVVAVVAMATPVGWVTVLAVGTVGAVGGSLAGERIGKWINEAEFFDPLGRRLEGLVTDWPDEVRDGVIEAFKSAKAGAGDFATGIVEVGEAIGEGLADGAQGAWDAFSDGAEKVGGHLSDFGSATADGAANAWESVSDWFDD